MAKPKKDHKVSREQQQNQTNQSAKKVSLTGTFLDTLKESLTDFSKLPEEQRNRLYGNQEFLDQFREYFKKECPSLKGLIRKEDLPGYLDLLEKK